MREKDVSTPQRLLRPWETPAATTAPVNVDVCTYMTGVCEGASRREGGMEAGNTGGRGGWE